MNRRFDLLQFNTAPKVKMNSLHGLKILSSGDFRKQFYGIFFNLNVHCRHIALIKDGGKNREIAYRPIPQYEKMVYNGGFETFNFCYS